jgi:hypothetical protein
MPNSERDYVKFDQENQINSLMYKIEEAQKIIKIEGSGKASLEQTLDKISNLDILTEKISNILKMILK